MNCWLFYIKLLLYNKETSIPLTMNEINSLFFMNLIGILLLDRSPCLFVSCRLMTMPTHTHTNTKSHTHTLTNTKSHTHTSPGWRWQHTSPLSCHGSSVCHGPPPCSSLRGTAHCTGARDVHGRKSQILIKIASWYLCANCLTGSYLDARISITCVDTYVLAPQLCKF